MYVCIFLLFATPTLINAPPLFLTKAPRLHQTGTKKSCKMTSNLSLLVYR